MNHLSPLIRDLTFILLTASVVTLLFRRLKFPLVLGYLAAGIVMSLLIPFFPTPLDMQNLEVWAEIGLIFLLFGLGLEFSYKRLVHLGPSPFITGLFEVVGVMTASYFLARCLGWSSTESLFFGAALSISSTSIVVRSIQDLNLKGRRFVSLVYGVLLVEDLLAVMLLVLLSTVTTARNVDGLELMQTLGQFAFFLLLCFVMGMYLVPLFLQKIRSFLTNETMVILAVGLCLLMVVTATHAGLSAALGAFLMGSILAGTPEGKAIEERLEPLRDFFSAIFFVSIGMLIQLQMLWENISLVFEVATFLILAKFLFVTLGFLLGRQTISRSIQGGLAMTQIGEFSFLIAKIGVLMNVVSPVFFPLVILVSATTSFATPVLLRSVDPLSAKIEKILPAWFKNGVSHFQNEMTQKNNRAPLLRALWRAYGMKILLNLVLVLGVTFLTRRWLYPVLAPAWPWTDQTLKALCVTTCAMLSLPFLWALLMGRPSRSAHFDPDIWEKMKRWQVMIISTRTVLAALLIFFIVTQFVKLQTSLLMLAVLLATLAIFRKHIEQVYRPFESRFLDHLNEKERQDQEVTDRPELAPWDTEMVALTMTSDSPLAGKSLKEAGLQERYNLMIAVIERGSRRILTPNREETLYPNDRLFVIGTEDQIIKARSEVEVKATVWSTPFSEDFGLDFLLIDPGSLFVGKTIRDSGLREKTDALVVGLERNGRRLLNPSSDLILKPLDLVWLLGSRSKVRHHQTLFGGLFLNPLGHQETKIESFPGS